MYIYIKLTHFAVYLKLTQECKSTIQGFPGGPAAEMPSSQSRAGVRSLVRELDPACVNKDPTCCN